MKEKIKENLMLLEKKINKACEESGRKREEILLVAVTKRIDNIRIRDALDCGLRVFGENRPQELREKMLIFEEEKIHWHMIGNLQKNKLKYLVGKTDLIHSADSMGILEEIQKFCNKENCTQRVLLEVNISGEETKHGIKPEEVKKILEESIKLHMIKICGIMTMAPLTDDEKIIQNVFRQAKEIQNSLSDYFKDFIELSMGMSNDYEIAVREGATMLRIGTSIFGER